MCMCVSCVFVCMYVCVVCVCVYWGGRVRVAFAKCARPAFVCLCMSRVLVVRWCVCVCVCACVRARVCVCVYVCVCGSLSDCNSASALRPPTA